MPELFYNHQFDSSPVVYELPARSVPRFSLVTAPVLTFSFTGRDAAITMNSVKIDHAVAAYSTIGYHSNVAELVVDLPCIGLYAYSISTGKMLIYQQNCKRRCMHGCGDCGDDGC